jgi:hypothetical protein
VQKSDRLRIFESHSQAFESVGVTMSAEDAHFDFAHLRAAPQVLICQ